jgi:hypothetical protein
LLGFTGLEGLILFVIKKIHGNPCFFLVNALASRHRQRRGEPDNQPFTKLRFFPGYYARASSSADLIVLSARGWLLRGVFRARSSLVARRGGVYLAVNFPFLPASRENNVSGYVCLCANVVVFLYYACCVRSHCEQHECNYRARHGLTKHELKRCVILFMIMRMQR